MGRTEINIAGRKYGNFTAIKLESYYISKDLIKYPIWRWRCDCGREFEKKTSLIKSGSTKYCSKECTLKPKDPVVLRADPLWPRRSKNARYPDKIS